MDISVGGQLLDPHINPFSARLRLTNNALRLNSKLTSSTVYRTGTPSTKTLTRLTLAETNARLHEHEASFAVHRPGNPVFRYDVNSLPSNNPIEDDSSCVILEREKGRGGVEGDLVSSLAEIGLWLCGGEWRGPRPA